MYRLAGRCFAGYLGYPTIEHFLHRSSSFSANLISGAVSGLYLTDPLRQLREPLAGADYERIIRELASCCKAENRNPDADAVFSAEHLIQQYQRGERYFSTETVYSENGKENRLLIGCELSEESDGICALFLICNITQIHDAGTSLLRRVEFDGLTGLYNRAAGDAHIMEYFREYPQDSAAILLIDIDFFKRFNDQYGHDIGDLVLRAAARQMEKFFGRDSVIVRNGGDEFLILLKRRTPDEVYEEISRFHAEPHVITSEERSYRFSFSIGYALCPEHGTEYHDLTVKADVAMYHVKMHHRSSFVRFHPEMLTQKRTQLSFHLGDIVSGIPGAILVYKADEREEILFANDQLFELFECDSMQELLQFSGDSFRNIVHPEDLDRVEREIAAQLKANTFGLDFVRYRILTKSGKVKIVDDIGHLVHTPRYGDIFYVFLYDLEQKKQIICAGEQQLSEESSLEA